MQVAPYSQSVHLAAGRRPLGAAAVDAGRSVCMYVCTYIHISLLPPNLSTWEIHRTWLRVRATPLAVWALQAELDPPL